MHFHLHTLLWAVVLSSTATIGVEAYTVLQTPEPLDPAWVSLVSAILTGLLSLITVITVGAVLLLSSSNKRDTDDKLADIHSDVSQIHSDVSQNIAALQELQQATLISLNATLLELGKVSGATKDA